MRRGGRPEDIRAVKGALLRAGLDPDVFGVDDLIHMLTVRRYTVDQIVQLAADGPPPSAGPGETAVTTA